MDSLKGVAHDTVLLFPVLPCGSAHGAIGLRGPMLSTVLSTAQATLATNPPSESQQEGAGRTSAQGIHMSEGYTIDGYDDEVAGIVVRYQGERGFRFHASSKAYDALDGHVFVTPAAAERAARDLGRPRFPRARAPAGPRAPHRSAADAHSHGGCPERSSLDCRLARAASRPPGRVSVLGQPVAPAGSGPPALFVQGRLCSCRKEHSRPARGPISGNRTERTAFQLECLRHEFFFVRMPPVCR